MRTATWIRALLFVMGAASVAALATPQTSGQAPQDSTPRFRSGVELVDVAVSVRDADARLVRDLEAADFEVREDGQPQRVVAFERVEIPVPASALGEPAASAVPSDVGSNEGTADFRVFVIVLDAVHVSSQRTPYVRAHAKRFIEEYMAPGDLAAVFSPGALEEATQDFTRDKARLLAAIDRFAGSKLRSATVERHEEAKRGEGVGMILHGGRDPDDGERAIRSRALTGSLEALARHLDRIRGRRKTLLLFTEGVDYDLTDINGSLQRYGADVMRGLGRALGALQRSNVAVYPIDPRGLSSAEGDQVETPIYEPERRDPNAPTVHGEFGTTIRWMRTLAEATGGFAVVDRNDRGPAYERILEESSHYYVLGYSPARPAEAGESRTITVTVRRPGLQVFARKGYVVPAAARPARDDSAFFEPAAPVGPPGRPRTGRTMPLEVDRPAARPAGVDSTLAELLASPLPAGGLPIRVQAVPLRGNGRRTTVGLVIEVMGRPLTFTPRGNRFEERIELALITVDGRGRGSNGTSTKIDLRLTPEEVERVRTTGVRWLSRLDLPPGRHQIRVAGRTPGTGLTGVTTHDIDVPSFEGGQAVLGGITLTSLPSVLMVTRGDAWLEEAIPTPPSAERRFVAGDRITAAAEVHLPDAREGSVVEVSARIDWPDGSRTPVGARKLQAPGKHSVAFDVDTRVLAPGRFVLRLTLSAPGRQPVERAVPFEVLERQ